MASRIEAKINKEDLIILCDCNRRHPIYEIMKENPSILYNEDFTTLVVSKCNTCGKQTAFRVGADTFDIYNK